MRDDQDRLIAMGRSQPLKGCCDPRKYFALSLAARRWDVERISPAQFSDLWKSSDGLLAG